MFLAVDLEEVVLPLHASSPFKSGIRNLLDMYTCSYTPAITSLLQSHHQPEVWVAPRLLIATQWRPNNGVELQSVSAKIASISQLVEQTTVIEGEVTSEGVALSSLQISSGGSFCMIKFLTICLHLTFPSRMTSPFATSWNCIFCRPSWPCCQFAILSSEIARHPMKPHILPQECCSLGSTLWLEQCGHVKMKMVQY